MTALNSTKRMTSALTKDGRASSRSAFVIPSLDGTCRFVELSGKKLHEHAYLAFIGRPITAEDVVAKLSPDLEDRDEVISFLNCFILELQRFKIGNVVAIEELDGSVIRLRKVAERPVAEQGPKLP
jgi:hypothetical protein